MRLLFTAILWRLSSPLGILHLRVSGVGLLEGCWLFLSILKHHSVLLASEIDENFRSGVFCTILGQFILFRSEPIRRRASMTSWSINKGVSTWWSLIILLQEVRDYIWVENASVWRRIGLIAALKSNFTSDIYLMNLIDHKRLGHVQTFLNYLSFGWISHLLPRFHCFSYHYGVGLWAFSKLDWC